MLGLFRTGRCRAAWMHRWCRRFLRAIGVEAESAGELPARGAVVCNHLSYLDIVVLMAAQPCVMVAKTEVRGWPLIGRLTALAGTVYVRRGGGPSTHAAVNESMRAAYATGLPVVFFPEGTTTDGRELLPFRRGLFHSVLDGEQPLRVAALQYSMGWNGGATVEDDICWWGEATFAPHLIRFLGLREVRAAVQFGEEVAARADRFALSKAARARVGSLCEELVLRRRVAAGRAAVQEAGLAEGVDYGGERPVETNA